ncbi:MAG: hypothetical protein H0V80_03595 [Acidobacteria bacterium]|nr:hypothetical protein [Acidobacteriota bacterium]
MAVDLSGSDPLIGALLSRFALPFRGYDMRYHYGVMSDAQRFVVNAPITGAVSTPATVVLNAPLP